jgi:hypothetical protein
MSEFMVRSDSGEMSGSEELYEWANQFRKQYGTCPLELLSSDGQVWLTGASGFDPADTLGKSESEMGGLTQQTRANNGAMSKDACCVRL